MNTIGSDGPQHPTLPLASIDRLRALRDQIKAAPKGSQELDEALRLLLTIHERQAVKAFIQPSASIDDALAYLNILLPDWWLHTMREERTEVIYRDDEHKPTGAWSAAIQSKRGGQLTFGSAHTPALALIDAVLNVRIGMVSGRWTI
ncbi:MAG: hypothetical protein AB7S41_09015 [Parvibaculaceae bacterium]